jgi:hypothetical protein
MSGTENSSASPSFRATFSECGLVLTAWAPFLVQRGGPYGSIIRNHVSAPAVFDLTIERKTNEDGIWVATDLFVTEVVSLEDDVPRRTLCRGRRRLIIAGSGGVTR